MPFERTTKLDQTVGPALLRVRNCAVRNASAACPETR
jgi:hypothetical protein